MINHVNGNMLESDAKIICHQVNCQGVMGAGLAKQIHNKYPNVFNKYIKYCLTLKPLQLLGKVLFVGVSDNKIIANCFGQINYGRNGRYSDYQAIRSYLNTVKEKGKQIHNCEIAIPYKRGCGLAGGNWEIVRLIIEEVFKDYDGVVGIYKLV